jgi:hypothetical protein
MSARAALKVLFELLENYAPMWYTEEHHNLAVDALEKPAENVPADAATNGNVVQIQSHRYEVRDAGTGARGGNVALDRAGASSGGARNEDQKKSAALTRRAQRTNERMKLLS